MPGWWLHIADRTREDEKKVADTRARLERVLRQLEAATQQLREVLDDDRELGRRGEAGPEPGSDRRLDGSHD